MATRPLVKSDLEAVAASISKLNQATIEAMHFVERGNIAFAAAAIRLGEQHLKALVDEYAALLSQVPRT